MMLAGICYYTNLNCERIRDKGVREQKVKKKKRCYALTFILFHGKDEGMEDGTGEEAIARQAVG